MAKNNNKGGGNKVSAKAQAAPAKVPAPMPSYNSSVQNARYITDLNPVGSPEYNRWNDKLGGEYDGGGWVTWNKQMGAGDSGKLASDDDMRAFARANAYREVNGIGGGYGSNEDVNRFASMWSGPSNQAAKPNESAKGSGNLKQARGLNQALRIAGMNGNISKGELGKITDRFASGDYGKTVQRLDLVNSRRLNNKKQEIGLGASAYNAATSGKLQSPGGFMFGGESFGKGGFGNGTIGSAIQSGMRTYSREGGINDPLKVQRGQSVTGMTAKGDIRSRDKYGGGFTAGTKAASTNTGGSDSGMNTSGSGDFNIGPMADQYGPSTTPTSNSFENIGGLYGGGDAAGGAMGIKARRSSKKTKGLSTSGTSQLSRGMLIGNSINLGR